MNFLDLLTILSFIVGLENLRLNDLQMAQIDDHLSNQDEHLLKEIIRQNKEIIDLLKKE